MYLINEINKAFSECFNGINNTMVLDNSIEKSIFLVQLEVTIDNIKEILKKKSDFIDDADFLKFREYLSLCELCMYFDKTNNQIDSMIYKEEYLSEEIYKFLIIQLEYIGRKIHNIYKYDDSRKVEKYLNYCLGKYCMYVEALKEKLDKRKIK